METLRKALWQGLINGAASRDRAAVPSAVGLGFSGELAQGLYNLGVQLANAVVYGERK